MILMQGDFFQVLRRVQKEERNKSSLARVDNDFYKHIRDYIRDLERSVASDPFGNEQLLLNNAQRIATEICELRESKITQAANNNIYRSFLLFKKDNPQFDLLDTTPLNLTDEEETLYFSLMDALKNHRYRISLDEFTDESIISQEEEDFDEEDFDEDEETAFVEDSYEESDVSIESEPISDELEDEISDVLGEADEEIGEDMVVELSGEVAGDEVRESDELLDRLNQIKNAKVITDEKYENIDKQVANQMYPGQDNADDAQSIEETANLEEELEEETTLTEEPKEEVQTSTEKSSKEENFVSSSLDDIFKNPDDQFIDLDKLEPNYEDDFHNSIAAASNYANPTEDDFNMIFAKPKKSKAEAAGTELGFSSGLDAKEKKDSDKLNKVNQNKVDQTTKKEDAPKKPVDKTRGGVFAKDEIENTTVVISEDIDEMVGIDGKVYGPFLANDVVILPNITAKILIDNNKASMVKF